MHKHHIIPRHLGGTDESENLVEVSVEEHAKIHHSLWILGGRWQDEIAWKSLTGQIGREEARLLACKKAMEGYKHSVETKKKMRLAKLGKKQAPEHIKNRFKWQKGYKHSEETKQKIGQANSIALKGRTRSEEEKKKISLAHKGLNTWSKGRKIPERKSPTPFSLEHRRNLSMAAKKQWEMRRSK